MPGWNVGQVLTADTLAQIRSTYDELQHQGEMYAACKTERWYWAAAIAGVGVVAFFIGKASK